MMKSVRVPLELIALNQMQRASIREVGAPLYLPAFEHQILEAEARREVDKSDDLDWGAAAGGLTVSADEDDDFY